MRRHRAYWTTMAIGLIAGFAFITTDSAANNNARKAVTFNKDVAPIFFNSCADCHRPGEAAPFSVLSYKEARPWARSIK
ncbi:MAG TPA: hypothetical protein VNO70_22255, partial [Blastocatellia bacterium]|nr:hypothetical protein [Blastocatellia bacterium]